MLRSLLSVMDIIVATVTNAGCLFLIIISWRSIVVVVAYKIHYFDIDQGINIFGITDATTFCCPGSFLGALCSIVSFAVCLVLCLPVSCS